MLYDTFETIEDEETTILAEKSTILDGGCRRCRQENVELKPPQPPVGVGDGMGLSSEIMTIGLVLTSPLSPLLDVVTCHFTYFAFNHIFIFLG